MLLIVIWPLWTPLYFGPLFQGEGTYPKKLDVKTFPICSSNRGHQSCSGRKCHLCKKPLFVQKRLQKYYIRDKTACVVVKEVLLWCSNKGPKRECWLALVCQITCLCNASLWLDNYNCTILSWHGFICKQSPAIFGPRKQLSLFSHGTSISDADNSSPRRLIFQ